MKSVLALTVALSALTAASAYAVPKAAPAPHAVVASSVATPVNASQAKAISAEKPVLVAENRSEFGSSYQRY